MYTKFILPLLGFCLLSNTYMFFYWVQNGPIDLDYTLQNWQRFSSLYSISWFDLIDHFDIQYLKYHKNWGTLSVFQRRTETFTLQQTKRIRQEGMGRNDFALLYLLVNLYLGIFVFSFSSCNKFLSWLKCLISHQVLQICLLFAISRLHFIDAD